jgi:Sulfotransferase family
LAEPNASELAARGLFIVGHARSGTTVLQRALNTSPDVTVLGEANIHTRAAAAGFADWYNAMHVSFGNPPAKGDRCPEINGDAFDVFAELARHYRWVGDKMAFRDESLGYDFDGAIRFFMRWFPKSVYICTLRNPRDTLVSSEQMFHPENRRLYTLSYAKCLLHLANTYLTFDRTLVAQYESLSQASFDRIAGYLDTPLHEACTEYDPARQTARRDFPEAGSAREVLMVLDAYERLARLIDSESLRIPNRSALRELQRDLAGLVVELSSRLHDAPAVHAGERTLRISAGG